MQLTRIPALWPALAALLLASVLAIWSHGVSRTTRLSNLDLESTGIAETYLMTDKSEPGRGYIVGRRASTVRRSDSAQQGDRWRLDRIPGASGDTWIAQSKRKGKGTVFYVPYPDVPDPVYPYYYRFVRELRRELELPQVSWTSLFVNRVYQGLYLRVSLPFDPRKKDGGSGILREILAVEGDRLMGIDSRFDDAPGVYVDSIASGVFPRLREPAPALAWLARRAPTAETTLLIQNVEPWSVSLLPLPVSLPALFRARYGRAPASFHDARYARWVNAGWREGEELEPFDAAEREALEAGLEAYASRLRAGLRAHVTLHQSGDLLASLDRRLGEL